MKARRRQVRGVIVVVVVGGGVVAPFIFTFFTNQHFSGCLVFWKSARKLA
jgi:hypothetical protein